MLYEVITRRRVIALGSKERIFAVRSSSSKVSCSAVRSTTAFLFFAILRS